MTTEARSDREAPEQQVGTPATVPSAVLNVVNFATPGCPDSYQRWWNVHAFGSGEPGDVPLATGATAGAPGTWTPAGAKPPPTVALLIAKDPIDVKASPATNWTTGQYVQTGTAGGPGEANWNGTAWVAGRHA